MMTMPDFKKASVEEVLTYMVLDQGFGLEVAPTGYTCFQEGGNVPNATRFSQVYSQEKWGDFRNFIAKLAVWALWRRAEQAGHIEPELLKWEGYWLTDSENE
jgi:hypothetical protein